MLTVNIYTLTNPLNNEVFYVGRCISKLQTRLCGHIKDAKIGGVFIKKSKVINEILSNGLLPIIEPIETIVCTCKEDEKIANILEQYWINQFCCWGFNLTNKWGVGKYTQIQRTSEIWHIPDAIPTPPIKMQGENSIDYAFRKNEWKLEQLSIKPMYKYGY